MDLRIKVGEAISHPSGYQVDSQIENLDELALSEIKVAPEQKLAYRLMRIPDGLALLINDQSLKVEVTCQRCLENYSTELSIDDAEAIFYQQIPEDNVDPEDCFMIEHKHMEIDLEPFLSEIIQLSLPDRLVCREDCSGIDYNGGSQSQNQPNPFRELLG